MIDRIIGTCLRKRGVVVVVAILLVAFGYYAWKELTVEAYPDIGDVTAQVSTQAPGLASEEVEQEITIPLERALAGTPGLANMRSSSTFGLSLITLIFSEGAEDYWSRQRVTERVNSVTLPPGIQPGLDPVTGPAGEIYRYTLESDSKNLMELSEIQKWTVIPALKQVAGVVDVANFGGFTMQYQVDLDPVELQRFGVGLNDVVAAINNNSSNAGGSRISRGEQGYVIRGIGMVRTLGDIGAIVVTQRSGVPILVRDLGKLVYSHQEREGILGKNANPDTIEGIVLLLKYQNPSEVLKGIHAQVAELTKQLEPMGVRIVPYIDRDNLVQMTIDKVSHTVLAGILLVFVVLMIFLGNPRIALTAGVTIPFALVVLFIVMHLTKMSANLFSLGAIDFGIIVDGAIVVTDACLRKREANPAGILSEDDLFSATTQVARPIFFATLIIITAYIPLFAFTHVEAKLFLPMAYTVSLALLGALLCTFTLIPGLTFMALRKPRRVFRNRPLELLQTGFRRSLDRMLSMPKIAFIIGGGAMVAVVLLGMTTGREFLPELDEGTLWLQVQMPTGLSLDKASEMADELRRTLREFPEVSYVVTQLGRNDDGTDPWTPSHIEAPVGLKPYDTWPKGETRVDFLRRLNARLKQLPGFSIGISQPIIDMVYDIIGGAHSPLVIRIYGDDFNELRRMGGEIIKVLDGIQGTAEASIFQEPPIPQIVIDIDRAAAARYGINVSDITTLIQTGVGGAPVSTVYVQDRTYGITARFPKDCRNSPEALGNLVLTTASGAQIPLSQVAGIKLRTGESTISHEMTRRALLVRVDNRDHALSNYLAEARSKINQSVQYDHGKYHIEYGGQFESAQRAEARLTLIMGLVLALMLVFLFAEFGKLRQALLVLGAVPLATLGGLIALHLTGETLNVASAVGFIALFGVAVQNGIIMIANIRRVREEGAALREAVLSGAVERFRPVLMTATVATVGMLPAALATGVGTDVQRNLATVVVGGLMIATLLTLFILPTCFFSMERWVEGRQK
ncbi:Cobalt-zinc-cadmium resistance protein [Syntrophobacter sp. SbD1]|nr:Cobalt-zinc-cadmium resistance protein [Syntrophobacter sp. SbD1]